MQTKNAFGNVESAFSWFMQNYSSISRWRAVVQRLEGFETCISQTSTLRDYVKDALHKQRSVDGVVIKSLTLKLRSNKSILSDINFTVQQGKSVLIHGPSGCGKSTFLRAISGVWPFAAGQVSLPGNGTIMMIPQKPYLPIDTLRAAMTYPFPSDFVSDVELIDLLKLCRLEHLEPRLNETENWSQILSPGEQQRIAFLRIFHQRPNWLFLDEDTQATLYQAISHRLPQVTLVSVAHRSSLRSFHDLHFDLGKGDWIQTK